MGKYTLQASNQLGTAECNCDLIVRKKQFPPVFWQRLYNVSGEKDSTRYVGGVEVGGEHTSPAQQCSSCCANIVMVGIA